MTRSALEIPRSTCRLFGTIKALSTIRKSAILVHGPKGCVYHINYILGMRGDRPPEIYTTSLDEQDVIFGAEGKLVSAIGELDRRLSPDLIFVLSCCASSIIGEDVESACRDARARARVIGFASGGFEGDHHTAYGEALTRLAEELALPPAGPPLPRTVNLVGMLRGGPDLGELKRVLALAGVRVQGVLSAGATLGELEGLGRASLNIVVCEPAGRAPAGYLERRFGTPFIIVEFPVGARAAVSFLGRVSAALGIPLDPRALEGEPGPVPRGGGVSGHPGAAGGTILPPLRAAVIGGPTRVVPMVRFLRDRGLNPVLAVVDFDAGTREKLGPYGEEGLELLIEPSQEEILSRLRALGVELIVGGMLERPLAALLGIPLLDMMHGSQRTACFAGERDLPELIARLGSPSAPPGSDDRDPRGGPARHPSP
ncbi:MAG TPA: nitrogenase component 1 [Methanomicrobiales archaeon]|nr:nitrogenase component 1 [Methanomicrobiales archaeon]